MLVQAHAFLTFDGDASDPANVVAIGCEVFRNGVGDYSIFLDNGGVNIAAVAYSLQGNVNLQITDIADDEKQLTALTNNTGAPTDAFTVSLGVYSVDGGGVSQ